MGIWGSTVVAVQILRKIFFRPSWIFHRQEQPKRPPNPPGLASIAAAVLWQRYFNCHNRGPPYGHFFYEKNFFRPSLIFRRQEQPKRRPKPPGLASIATTVLWQQYFNCHNRGRIERNWGTVARALLQQWKRARVGFGAILAAFDGCNSSWAEKIKFRKKMGGTPKLDFRGHFFYPKIF